MATAKSLADKPLPKTLAACADEYYEVMQARLVKQREADELKKRETKLADHLINKLPASDATGVAGKVVRVSIVKRTRNEVEDWGAVHAHILKNAKKDPGVWSLLQRRLGDAAIDEIVATGKKVPGVTQVEYKKISYSVVK